jgi:hypothetical protein
VNQSTEQPDLVPPAFRLAMGWAHPQGHHPVVAHITPSRWSVGPPFFVGCCSCGWSADSRTALAAAMDDAQGHAVATRSGEVRFIDPDAESRYDLSFGARVLWGVFLLLAILGFEAVLISMMTDARMKDPFSFHQGVSAGLIVTAIFGAGAVSEAILRRKWWSAPSARPWVLGTLLQLGWLALIPMLQLFPRYGSSHASPFTVGWEATFLAAFFGWLAAYLIWVTYRNYRYGFWPISFTRGTASGMPCATWLLHFSAVEAAGRPVTVARCDCGWSGRLRLDRESAKRDAERHAPHHNAPTHGIETRLEVRRSLMSRVERHRAKPYGFAPPVAHRSAS